VNPVGAGGDHLAQFLAQTGEVGREDGGGDAVSRAHGAIVAASDALELEPPASAETHLFYEQMFEYRLIVSKNEILN
jgi:hypothetical protein